MNDAERRQLERDATEHVAEGIIHYGTAGMSEFDRRSFVEKLAREAIDEAARSMVQRGVTTPSPEEEDQIVRRLVATQLGLGRLNSSWTRTTSRTSTSMVPTTSGSNAPTASKNVSKPIGGQRRRPDRTGPTCRPGAPYGGERRIDSAKPSSISISPVGTDSRP